MSDLNTSKQAFKDNISNSYWMTNFGVPLARFNERREYL